MRPSKRPFQIANADLTIQKDYTNRDSGYRNGFSHPSASYSPEHEHLQLAVSALHRICGSMEYMSMDFVFHALELCAVNHCLSAAKEIHFLLTFSGFDSDAFIVCHLIRTYASLEDLGSAWKVFLKAHEPTHFSWSAIISAHANLGQESIALKLYNQMQVLKVGLDGHVFVAALKACTAAVDLHEGQTIHSHMIAHALNSNEFSGGFLINMYVTCSSLEEASIAFQVLPRKGVASWNALIAGYVNNGEDLRALEIFFIMQQEHTASSVSQLDDGCEDAAKPDTITYLHVLKLCAHLGVIEEGHSVHADIVGRGLGTDLSVGNTLIDMYGKCGNIQDACTFFHALPAQDVVSWSVLISSHTQHGYSSEALELFKQMQAEHIQPDSFTIVCTLKACSMQGAIDKGRKIHEHVVATGIESDIFIVSALIDMYSKCECCTDARSIFDQFQDSGLVTWNAMISGYVQFGDLQEALALYDQMCEEGILACQVTYLSVLKACSGLAALRKGLNVQSNIIRDGFEGDLCINTTLIDLYSQSGSLVDACRIFNTILEPDVVSWNALIAACAQHNASQLAFDSFHSMQQFGIIPNNATFVCILSVCSHAGLVKEGCSQFKLMRDYYCVSPSLEHYDSLIDIFGHGGCLEEAEDLLETLPFAPDLTEWTSLLSSCRMHADVSIGERSFDRFVSMNHANASAYALMSDIYAQAGRQVDADEVEKLRKYANAWKKPAKAFIEIETRIHEFSVGDESHPQIEDIYAKLRELRQRMSEGGYKARVDLVLNDEVDKLKSLCGHCEKLAIAFGLICTPSGTTIRVSKNLRVCADCHNASKVISKIEKREIIISDAFRCHHFKEGDCSCESHY
ncbi:hypothetical protein KP509_33G050800 [Ceratopteris richardii]|nr:hypothetical protein KP509_33G050800 [Ceratopteris richardii]